MRPLSLPTEVSKQPFLNMTCPFPDPGPGLYEYPDPVSSCGVYEYHAHRPGLIGYDEYGCSLCSESGREPKRPESQPNAPPEPLDSDFADVSASCGDIDTYPLHKDTRIAYLLYDRFMAYDYPTLSQDYLNITDMHEFARTFTVNAIHCSIDQLPDNCKVLIAIDGSGGVKNIEGRRWRGLLGLCGICL